MFRRRCVAALALCLGACVCQFSTTTHPVADGIYRTPSATVRPELPAGVLHLAQAKELTIEDERVTVRYEHEGRQVVEVWRRH